MSFDLMVFEPATAPRDHAAFMEWYYTQTEWAEDHSYDDPAVASPALQAWYAEIAAIFPNMATDLSNDIDDEDSRLTDYSIGRDMIYVGFAWSEADNAQTTARALAEKHSVGFFNVSAEQGEVWYPPKVKSGG